MWYRGSIQLSADATVTSRYLHEVDLAAAAGSVTLTLPATGPDPTYVGVTNASTIADGSKVVIVQTAAAVEVCRLSAAGESVWLGRNPITGAWELLAHDNPSEYQWTWANAQARTACLVSSAQVGKVGWQSDLELGYRLISASPLRFAPLSDPAILQPRYELGVPNLNTLVSGYGILYAGQSGGTITGKTATDTTASLRLIRTAYVSAASPVGATIIRETNGGAPWPLGSFRARYLTVLYNNGDASANWQWFLGMSRAAIGGTVAPSSLFNLIGIGADTADGNVQIMHNGPAGTAEKQTLGAGFPARTNGLGYELEIFTADPTVSWVVQARNINSGEEQSFTFTSEFPDQASFLYNSYYTNTGGDSVSVGLDFAGFMYGQRVR